MNWFKRSLGDGARWLVRRLVHFYYPQIEVRGRERLPASGAVLFVANHPNSLIDPVLIGLAASRPVHFLAKAPLFEVPVLGPVLHALGMVPAYRGSDDASQVKRNLESLSAAAACLAKGEAVGLFPEGKTHDHLKLEHVRTGAARIALQAVEQGTVGLKVVPIGLNYERKEQFRSAVWLRVGHPIHPEHWRREHPEDPRKAMRGLTAEIDQRLKELVVHLAEEQWEPFVEELEVFLPPPAESVRNPFARLRQRRRIADAMNHFLDCDRPRAEAMAAAITAHREQLAAAGLNARSPLLRWRGWRLAWQLGLEAALMCAGFVLVLFGTLHHLVPFAANRLAARRVQHPGLTTTAQARLLLGLPIYSLWYLAVGWWMAHYFLPWVAIAWAAAMPFAGLLALRYWYRVKRTSGLWWRQLGMLLQPVRVQALRRGQEEVELRLRQFAADYARSRVLKPLPPNPFSWPRFWRSAAKWTGAAVIAVLLLGWALAWYKQSRLAGLQTPGPSLAELAPEALTASLAGDERVLADIANGLRDLEARATQLQADFDSGRRTYYRQADDDAVRQCLFSYLTFRTTLVSFVWKYQNHPQVGDEALRVRTFLLHLAAASALHDASLKFVTRFGRSPETVRKLNEAEPAWNIPAGVYDMVKRNLLHARTREYMATAWEQYQQSGRLFEKYGLGNTMPYTAFHEAIRRQAETRSELLALLLKEQAAAPVREAGRLGEGVGYRVQAFVSTWLGSTRIREPLRGRQMIQPAQLAQVRAQLQPGDILLERQNWYLSRAFMPGFWAHAALYVGTTNDLARLGLAGDERVRRHWAAYASPDREGHELLILEAVPEGVRATTLEHCLGVADFAAVLRPRLDERRISEGIARAFGHLGKPYDFDFDFFTTDKLVCTELVYRCYDGHLNFPLVDVMGRKTLPPTELARKYAAERNAPGAQLDCVCFLDGDETTGRATFKTADAFATTIARPGLTWLQRQRAD